MFEGVMPRNNVDTKKSPATGTPSILPRADFHFPGEVGRTFLDSDPAQFPQPVQAPKGAPNILLILIDDVGYGQFSTLAAGCHHRRWINWPRSSGPWRGFYFTHME